MGQKRRAIKRNRKEVENQSLGGLPVQPGALTEENMRDAFGQELFPRDGRGSTSKEKDPKQVEHASEEITEIISEHSINASHTPSR